MAADTDQPGQEKLELLQKRNTAVWFCRWLEIYKNTSRYSSKTRTGKVLWWKGVFLGEEESLFLKCW